LEPITSDDRIVTVGVAKATIGAAVELLEELNHPEITAFADNLQERIPALLALLEWLEQQLASVRKGLDGVTDAFIIIIWAWQHRQDLHLNIVTNIPAALQLVVRAFWDTLPVPPFLQPGRAPAQLAAPALADSPWYVQAVVAFAKTFLEPPQAPTGPTCRQQQSPETGRRGGCAFPGRSLRSVVPFQPVCPTSLIFQGAERCQSIYVNLSFLLGSRPIELAVFAQVIRVNRPMRLGSYP